MKNHAESLPRPLLRAERVRRQWSQQDLAERVGTSVVTINRWERGVTTPSAYFRLKLTSLFGKSAEELGLLPDESDVRLDTSTLPTSAVATRGAVDIPALWLLPFRRNPFFTGRDALLTHLHALVQSQPDQVYALSGLGGIGKTQTVIEYAYRFRDEYQCVLWLRCESYDVLLADCLSLLQRLALPLQTREQGIEQVKSWLAGRRQWLLLLDNVEDPALVELLLPPFLTGHVLLTTRLHSSGPLARHLMLSEMTLEEGTTLLLRRSNQGEPGASSAERVAQAAELHTLLAGLPLALDQAGAYIEETGCRLADYVQRYHLHRKTLLARRGNNPMQHPASVAATVLLSVERVEQLHPASAELLRCCAFLHPDGVSEAVLIAGAALLGPLLAEVLSDPVQLDEAVACLRTLSLIQRHTGRQRITLHRLVQAVIRDTLSNEQQHLWATRIVRAINLAFPVEFEFESIAVHEELQVQIHGCVELITRWQLHGGEAAQLLSKAGRYLLQRGEYAHAEPLLRQALLISLSPSEFPIVEKIMEVGELYNALGMICEEGGRYAEARELYEQALALLGRDDTRDSLLASQALEHLGRLQFRLGAYLQSEQMLEQALALRERLLGTHHPNLLSLLHALATLYQRQGKYAATEGLLHRAVVLGQQVLGETHPSTLESISGLAILYRTQGRYEQAEELYQYMIASLSGDSSMAYQTVASLRGLSLVYALQEKYGQAEALGRQALAICQRTFGSRHPDTAESFCTLAMIYRMQRRYSHAEDVLSSARAIVSIVFSPVHPGIAEILSASGVISGLQGDYARAEQQLLQARTLLTQLFGQLHPDIAENSSALGVVYGLQGRYQQAERAFQEALAMQERLFGAQHLCVADTLQHLAVLHQQKGCSEAARQYAQRALAVREPLLDLDHPSVVECRVFLSALPVPAEDTDKHKD